jgi:flagellar FliL protein
MATNRIEGATAATGPDQESANTSAQAAPAASGGFKAWLPLIANVVLMPVLAYAMTVFVLLPKMSVSGHVAAGAVEGGGHTGGPSNGHGRKETSRVNVTLGSKVLVNVAGTMGTRYLQTNITLVGSKSDLKEAVEKNDAQLRDVAASVLASKTIGDLDKPGARNLIRTELVSAFNNVLGNGVVSEIFFTEFAIQ